mmetsp:Transcript_87280/g.244975  ORF Transcript_87280/g.244975 Transcript_87280/m.244975 type:complete len:168 (-) Transcript_87280:123-626(-)
MGGSPSKGNFVLSVKFVKSPPILAIGSSRFADFCESELEYRNLLCYNPNKYSKDECDRDCYGEQGVCTKYVLEGGKPHSTMCCWKASYRWHLEQVRNGDCAVMLRIVENQEWGPGQVIEAEMARRVGNRVIEVNGLQRGFLEEMADLFSIELRAFKARLLDAVKAWC